MKNKILEIKNLIDGMEYRSVMNRKAIEMAKENKIVILSGESDDILALDGFINDEVSAYDGLSYKLLDMDNYDNKIFEFMCNHKIELLWCPDKEKSWSFKVSESSLFERFNIMEDGEVYCEGIILVI